jgi:hypothetical protein
MSHTCRHNSEAVQPKRREGADSAAPYRGHVGFAHVAV